MIFKNKYKARIEAKIKELEADDRKIDHRSAHYLILQHSLSEQIKLLKDLLI